MGACRPAAALVALSLAISSAAAQEARPKVPKGGEAFQSEATRTLQRDEGANPGMLWVEHGANLWTTSAGAAAKSCADCHGGDGTSMRGVAARLPAVEAKTGALLNVEGWINRCRTQHQKADALPHESRDLLGLTAFVTFQSRGVPRNVSIDGSARPYFEAGRTFFQTRQGQLNLACAHCHDQNVGRRLRGDLISQGQSDGWPAYRLEWQTFGSLHRRLRACSLGVRAEVLEFGAPEYLALELYLAWRGRELPVDSPGVRK